MSDVKSAVLQAIYSAIDEVNEQLPPGRRVPHEPSARLSGSGGLLDSLGLVNLVVAAEQHIADRIGQAVVLTADTKLFEADGPMSTVQRFAEHVIKQVERAPS